MAGEPFSLPTVRAVGSTPLVTATMIRPADATQYAISDIIANSGTAASVVPITFSSVTRSSTGSTGYSGRVTGARCVITPASGTIVLPAFDLILFRPATNIPFQAGSYPADNAALTITSAAYLECIGVLPFLATSWRNSAGLATAAGAVMFQTSTFLTRPYAPFNLQSITGSSLVGILQAQNTWNPGAVANTFDFVLDIDQD